MLYRIYDILAGYAARIYGKLVHLLYVRPVLSGINEQASVLEIGAGYNPHFTKDRFPNVFHLDHATADELRAKYASDQHVGHLTDRIQNVDFVSDGSPIEDLIPPELRFDIVFSSHSLEHQIDLIGHLRSIEKLLAPGGRLLLILPDYRCSFDVFRYPTVTSDAILVHRDPGKVHRGKQIFDHMTRTVDINPIRRLRAPDKSAAKFNYPLAAGIDALDNAEKEEARYEDAHAWVFSPASFRLLLLELYMLGFIRLKVESISPTYKNQFFVVLQLCEDSESPSAEKIAEMETERLKLIKMARR